MNLYEKIKLTVPGRYAADLGEIAYGMHSQFSKEDIHKLTAARTYLERLAIQEIEREDVWVTELAARKAALSSSE